VRAALLLKNTRVFRRTFVTLAFGLLAAVVAHCAVYGSSHAMGGSWSQAFGAAALVGAFAIALVWFTFAWLSGSRLRDGSILASQIESALPSPALIAVAAILWFSLAESLERGHADAPAIVLALALALASLLTWGVARLVSRLIGLVVFRILTRSFEAREPARFAPARRIVPSASVLLARRRFARPPPV
jgi:hypothetical protein